MTSSIKSQNGRYTVGGTTEVDGNLLGWWERKKLRKDPSDQTYVLEQAYVGRADLLAHAFYNDTRLWWVIPQYNNIIDPVTEFVAGVVLRIPAYDRIRAELDTNSAVGGVKGSR